MLFRDGLSDAVSDIRKLC